LDEQTCGSGHEEGNAVNSLASTEIETASAGQIKASVTAGLRPSKPQFWHLLYRLGSQEAAVCCDKSKMGESLGGWGVLMESIEIFSLALCLISVDKSLH